MSNRRVECKHPTCNRSFESRDSMKQHFSASHSQAERRKEKYACELCNRSFRKEEGLQSHMRTFHLTPYDTQAPNSIAPPVLPSGQHHLLQSLACNDCGKSDFESADALHQHQWASPNHTHVSKSPNPNHGTRVRTCSQCHMKLPTAEDLERHFVDQHPSNIRPLITHVLNMDHSNPFQSNFQTSPQHSSYLRDYNNSMSFCRHGTVYLVVCVCAAGCKLGLSVPCP